MFKLIFFFILISMINIVSAQENTEDIPPQKNDKIKASSIFSKIDELKKLSYADIMDSLSGLERLVMDFVEQENLQCVSEVSYTEKDDAGNSVVKKRKLNHKERKICLKKVVEFRMSYLDKFYELRKILLSELHKSQFKDLEESNEKAKLELEKILTKYN